MHLFFMRLFCLVHWKMPNLSPNFCLPFLHKLFVDSQELYASQPVDIDLEVEVSLTRHLPAVPCWLAVHQTLQLLWLRLEVHHLLDQRHYQLFQLYQPCQLCQLYHWQSPRAVSLTTSLSRVTSATVRRAGLNQDLLSCSGAQEQVTGSRYKSSQVL